MELDNNDIFQTPVTGFGPPVKFEDIVNEITEPVLHDNMKAMYDYINSIVGELNDKLSDLKRQVDDNGKSLNMAHRRIDDLKSQFAYYRYGG